MVRFLAASHPEKDDPAAWGIIQVLDDPASPLQPFLGVGLFLLADPLANLMFHDPRLVPLLRIVSLLVPMDTLASMAYVFTISFKKTHYSVIANNIIAPLARLLLAAAFSRSGCPLRVSW